MPDHILSILKDLNHAEYTLLIIQYWMGIRQLLYSHMAVKKRKMHLSVLNRDVPSPLCCQQGDVQAQPPREHLPPSSIATGCATVGQTSWCTASASCRCSQLPDLVSGAYKEAVVGWKYGELSPRRW